MGFCTTLGFRHTTIRQKSMDEYLHDSLIEAVFTGINVVVIVTVHDVKTSTAFTLNKTQ